MNIHRLAGLQMLRINIFRPNPDLAVIQSSKIEGQPPPTVALEGQRQRRYYFYDKQATLHVSRLSREQSRTGEHEEGADALSVSRVRQEHG